MFAAELALGTGVVATILLVIYIELRLKFRKSFKPAMTESLVGALIIPALLGVCLLPFTEVALLAAFFSLPVFLVVGLVVGIIYRSKDDSMEQGTEEPPNQAL